VLLRARGVAFGAVTVVLAVSMVGLSAVAQDESDLDRARAQIAAVEADLASATAASEDASLNLVDARAALDRVEAVVNAVAQRVDAQQVEVDHTTMQVQRLVEQEELVRAAVRAKAVDLYKHGAGSELTTMIDASDIQSAIDRSAFLRIVGQNDQARIEDLDASVRRTQAARDVLDEQQVVLDGLLADQEVVMAEAQDVRDSRALAAATAAEEVDDLEHEHDELEDLEVEIERAIAERKAAEERARREAAAREAARVAAAEAAAVSAEAAAAATAADVEASSSDSSEDSPTTSVAPPPTSGSGYSWPLCGPVTSEFKWRWGRQHKGIDIDDTRTRNITAAQSGTVISAGWNSGGYGNLVLIQHGGGVVTAYAHASSIHVSSGQTVSRGQSIATVGTTGNSTGPHLHFETRVNGGAVNPRQFLSGGGC